MLRNKIAALVLGATGLMTGAVLWSAPAQAAPAGVCPAHPAQFVNKPVHLAANASDETLKCANLTGAKLDGLDLSQFDLQYANLTAATLLKTNLTEADLTGANLSAAKLDGATMTQVTLDKANATAASFKDAKLGQASMVGTLMIGANLTDAHLGQADLTDANFTNATLTGADLGQATMTRTIMTNAKGAPAPTDGVDDGTDVSTGTSVSLPHIGAWIGPAVVLLIVFVIGPIVSSSRRRARRTVQTYARPAAYTPPPAGTPPPTRTPPPARTPAAPQAPFPTVFQQATPQRSTPPQATPEQLVPQQATPYVPTVPEFPAWQPMTTSASMAEAQHVVEEEKPKRWFRKD